MYSKMRKKCIAYISALCMLVAGVPVSDAMPEMKMISIPASADISDNSLTYQMYSDYVEIVDCNTSEPEVTVPAEINGIPVTSIGAGAFADCSKLLSVTLPNSITTIGNEAFSGCSKLVFLDIPEHVVTIGNGAFRNCAITSAEIPADTQYIGNEAFYGCTHLTAIKTAAENQNYTSQDGVLYNKDMTVLIQYPSAKSAASYTVADSTEEIASGAFKDCPSLTKITVPSSVKRIGKEAFANCTGLEEVNLPASMESIGSYVFYECTALKSIAIPEGIQEIDVYAFSGCTELTSVSLPDTVTTIGRYAFYQCLNLNQVVLPENLNKIEAAAFQECVSLKSITLPAALSAIEERAFYRCETLSSIEIPDNVTSISEYAFDSCTGLKTVIIGNGVKYIRDWAFGSCENITSLELGNHVSYIGVNAFFSNSSLQELTIPESVSFLDNDAFWGCSALKEITLPKNVINIGSNTFGGCTNLSNISILNPDCIIADSEYTISNDTGVYTGTIQGYTDSTAQRYAEKYKRTFKSLGENPDAPPETTPPETIPPETEPPETIPPETEPPETIPPETEPPETIPPETEPPETIPPETEPPVPERDIDFIDRHDNWGFDNSDTNFSRGYYYMKDEYYNKLMDGLSNSEQATMEEAMRSKWGGSCYGFACTSILYSNGWLNVGNFQSGAECPYDVKSVPNDDVVSLLDYYLLIQNTDRIQQEVNNFFFNDSEEEKLKNLISCLEDGSPTLTCFHGYFGGWSWGGHAVIAYKVEYGNYSMSNGKQYDGKIYIYDNNSVEYDPNYCLYFNTSSWNWCIPAYSLDTSRYPSSMAYRDRLGLCTDDLSIINYHGYIDSKNSVGTIGTGDYIASLRSAPLNSEPIVQKIQEIKGNWYHASSSKDEIRRASSFTDGKQDNIQYIMLDAEAGYSMTLDKPEALNLSMRYENSYQKVKASSGSEARFSPEGRVEVIGDKTDYSINIVLDNEYLVTDWYNFNVSGSGVDNAVLEKTAQGYVLKADNLKNVKVNANNKEDSAVLNFSANADSVLLYEIDKYTIGVKLDSDGDGTYDKLIAQSPEPVTGDVTLDGEIDILDVITINKAVMGKETLTKRQVQFADVNQSGKPDSSDALSVLKYIVGLIQEL